VTPTARRVRVAVLSLIGGATLAIAIAVFGGLQLVHHRDRYVIEFKDTVYGLAVGNDVYFEGVQVGNVDDMRIVRDGAPHVRVVIAVDRETPIHADTNAFLLYAGLTGIKEVDLRGGGVGPLLRPGATIAVGASELDRLERNAMTIAERSAQLIDTANQIANHIAALTGGDELGTAVADARRAAAGFAKASDALTRILADNRDGVRDSLVSIQHATAGASELVAELDRVVRGNAGDIHDIVRQLRDAARSLKELTSEVRSSPSQLLFSKPRPERRLP
jgi:ABC-type transporter Mla subunit MlaD